MIKRFVLYNIVGIIGTALYLLLLILLVQFLKIDAVLSSSISYVFLILFVYTANKLFVFKTIDKTYASLLKFAIVSVVGFFLNAGIVYLTVNVLGWWYVSSLLIALFIVPASNSLMHNYWSFKDG